MQFHAERFHFTIGMYNINDTKDVYEREWKVKPIPRTAEKERHAWYAFDVFDILLKSRKMGYVQLIIPTNWRDGKTFEIPAVHRPGTAIC